MRVTEHRRQWMFAFTLVLLLACFLASFLLFVCAIYVKVNIDAHLHLLESRHSHVLPSLFLVAAMFCLPVNAASFYVHYRIRDPANRDQLFWLCWWLVIFVLVLVLVYLILVLAALIHISVLDDGFRVGLHRGMSQYSKGAELKREMDNVQIEYWCCGDDGYTDWFAYPWMSAGTLVLYESRKIKYLQHGGYYSDDTPFSCCDPQSPRPCIHHHVHTAHLHENYHPTKETTLYVRGCRPALMDVYRGVLLTVALTALLIAVLQILALLLMRLLQTSLHRAWELGDWTATTEGWIFRPSKKTQKTDREHFSVGNVGNVGSRLSRGELLDAGVGLDPSVRASRSFTRMATAGSSRSGRQYAKVGGNVNARSSRRYRRPAKVHRGRRTRRPQPELDQSDSNNCYDSETDGGSDVMCFHDDGVSLHHSRNMRDVLYFSSDSAAAGDPLVVTSPDIQSRDFYMHDRQGRLEREIHDRHERDDMINSHNRQDRYDTPDAQDGPDRYDRHYRHDIIDDKRDRQSRDKKLPYIKPRRNSREAKQRAGRPRDRLSRGSLLMKSLPVTATTNNSNAHHETSTDEAATSHQANGASQRHSKKQDDVLNRGLSFLADAVSRAHRKSRDPRWPYKYSPLPMHDDDQESNACVIDSNFCNHNSSFDFENETPHKQESMPTSPLVSATKPTSNDLEQNCRLYLDDLL